VTISGNRPPVVINTIPDDTLSLGGGDFVVDLDSIFSDPEGDTLIYRADSEDTLVAAAEIIGTILQVMPLDSGMSEIRVSADDGKGGMVSDTFTVTISGNRPPVVIDSIPDITLVARGMPFIIDPDTVFSDPDRDSLTYTASSTNEAVAKIDFQCRAVAVLPITIGSATITINADDGQGHITPTQFNVLVKEGPLIQVENIDESAAGEPISISVTVTDETGISRVTLNYRKGGDTLFIPLEMSANNNDRYAASIPAGEVTSRGVEYFAEVNTMNGLTSRTPLFNSPFPYYSIGVRTENLLKEQPQPGGTAQTAYRLISVPADLDKKSPSDVFVDDLGVYDDTRWRFFELQADQSYKEFPNTGEMLPGSAFWLIVEAADKIIDTGSGISVRTDEEFSITLNPGWNLIGNPFDFPISIDQLRFHHNNQSPELRTYNEEWNDPITEPVIELIPFEGYAVHNDLATPEVLSFNPDLTPDSCSISFPLASFQKSEPEWLIRIMAGCQDARDIDNVAMVVSGSSPERDLFDQPEPPPIGEYVSVYFSHPDWNTLTQRYCIDARPELGKGDGWEFEVRTNIQDQVRLNFEGLDAVPLHYQVWLVDKDLQIFQDLRQRSTYFFVGISRGVPKRFELVVGTKEFMEEKSNALQLLPLTFELFQNFPNPFNPSTTIRYGIPREEALTLAIYNILGQQVAVLLNGERKAAGYHRVIWDGRNEFGHKMASGIYLYELRSGGESRIQKMILMK
jgi:hypothetical protein